MMKRRIATLLAAVLFCLSLAGCGKDSGPAPADGGGTEQGTNQGTEQGTDQGTDQQGTGTETGTDQTVTRQPRRESLVPQELRDLLAGDWQDMVSRRAMMEVAEGETEEDKDFLVRIFWSNSYSDEVVWEMNVEYDPDTGELSYADGRKSHVVYADGGVIESEEVMWEGSEGKFTVSGDELHWQDSKEEDAGNSVFSRIYSSDISSEDYKENMFKIVTELEEGTAGSSLKHAQAAQEILSFATSRQIWNMEASSRNASVKKAFEGLTDEEKDLVRHYLGEGGTLANLIEDAFYNYESVKGNFEDAGVGDDMAALTQNDYAKRSWNALHAAILAVDQ